jgi:hypothetical protein
VLHESGAWGVGKSIWLRRVEGGGLSRVYPQGWQVLTLFHGEEGIERSHVGTPYALKAPICIFDQQVSS